MKFTTCSLNIWLKKLTKNWLKLDKKLAQKTSAKTLLKKDGWKTLLNESNLLVAH